MICDICKRYMGASIEVKIRGENKNLCSVCYNAWWIATRNNRRIK